MLGVILKRHREFKSALDNYRISDRGRQALEKVRLVLLLGPTSTGRSTIIQHLLNTGEYYFLVSDTTRQPRLNNGVIEQNGKDYWFRTEDEILYDVKNGEYIEAELIHNQQVSGIRVQELEKAEKQQKIAITDLDIK